VLRGEVDALPAWQQRCREHYAPRRLTLAIPDSAKELPGVLAQHTNISSVTAYICSGHSCQEPLTTLSGFTAALQGTA
jgi:uncharacterized protein YyaL (SSP411 family)